MKKILFLFTSLLALLLVGCKANAPMAQQGGKEDIAYLLFVSSGGEYKSQMVQVDLDGQKYEAKVQKQKTANRRGTQYTAPVGTHQLIVSSNGRTLYSKKVFLSAQEVKTITLP